VQKWRAVKLANKKRLAAYIQSIYGTEVNTDALFDIQVRCIFVSTGFGDCWWSPLLGPVCWGLVLRPVFATCFRGGFYGA
jgi:hypothetical protein